MNILNWFQDGWLMMRRTKPRYLSALVKKRSSLLLDVKGEKDCEMSLNFSISVIIMCCSFTYGVILLLLEDVSLTASTILVPLIIAGICAFLGGLCVSEYMFQHAQEVPSIYSCCYQYSSEILAFFIGWSWLFSQAAIIAAICKVLVHIVSLWSGNSLLEVLENTFSVYVEAVPCSIFVLAFYIFVFTGFGETVIWFIIFVPLAFILVVTAIALTHLEDNRKPFSFDGSWLKIISIDQVLSGASLCLLFFSGPQSVLRITQKTARQKTTLSLGLLNVIIFFLVFLLLTTSTESGKLFVLQLPPDNAVSLATNIIFVIGLCILVIETFHPLHFVIRDMSADGLLFRSFSKKWKPLCFLVASPLVELLTMIAIILLSVFLPVLKLLIFSALFPLFVYTIIPLLVLNQRYGDNSSWQYEPMFQTTARNVRTRSRKNTEESQYTNGRTNGIGFDNNDNLELTTTCIAEDTSESHSDTDIESVVQQYKDQAKIANMRILEEHSSSDQVPEPTPSSSFRAKLCIVALLLTSTVNAIVMNLAHLDQYYIFGVVVLICVLFSIVVQSMLLCLPQNKNTHIRCCSKLPPMPWTPAMTSLISTCLFLHCLLMVWKVYLGWFILGSLIYFMYGARSSTAANSFHNFHIALRPLPSYKQNCVTQIIPSQRKAFKDKNKKIKRKILM